MGDTFRETLTELLEEFSPALLVQAIDQRDALAADEETVLVDAFNTWCSVPSEAAAFHNARAVMAVELK